MTPAGTFMLHGAPWPQVDRALCDNPHCELHKLDQKYYNPAQMMSSDSGLTGLLIQMVDSPFGLQQPQVEFSRHQVPITIANVQLTTDQGHKIHGKFCQKCWGFISFLLENQVL